MGVEDGTGGIINEDDEGGGVKKEEGFTRLVARLLLLLESGFSWTGKGGADEDDKGDGI